MVLFLGIFVIGCSDLNELHNDPNRSTTTKPQLILTTLEVAAFSNNVSENSTFTNRYMVYTESSSPYQYYNWQTGSFDYYDDIKQSLKMEDEATSSSDTIYNFIQVF